MLIRCHIQEDPDTIDRLIADAEATYNNFRHPDPYIGKHVTHLLANTVPTIILHPPQNIISVNVLLFRSVSKDR